MNLTPEDRQRIYEEEKDRIAAQSGQLAQPQRASSKLTCLGVGCGVVAAVLAVVFLCVAGLGYVIYKASDLDDAFNSGLQGTTPPTKFVKVEWRLAPEGFDRSTFMRRPQGTLWAPVYVRVTNHGYDKVPVNPAYCALNINGTSYSFGPVPVKRDLPLCELSSGASTDGYVGFEIPANVRATTARFEFKPLVLFENYEVQYEMLGDSSSPRSKP